MSVPKQEVTPRTRLERIGRASGMAEGIAAMSAQVASLANGVLPSKHPAGALADELRIMALRLAAVLDETLKRCP